MMIKEYKEEILELYENNYSVEQIIEFLSKNKVTIKKAALYRFIKKHRDDKVMGHFFRDVDKIVEESKSTN